MDISLVLLPGGLASLLGAMILMVATRSALRTGVVANDMLAGGYRRDADPLFYWYFVSTGMLGTGAFLALAVFAIRAACRL